MEIIVNVAMEFILIFISHTPILLLTIDCIDVLWMGNVCLENFLKHK
jgi:hypothetical protein